MTEEEARQVFRDMEAHVRYSVISIQGLSGRRLLSATGRREPDDLVTAVCIGAFRADDRELLTAVARKLFRTKAD